MAEHLSNASYCTTEGSRPIVLPFPFKLKQMHRNRDCPLWIQFRMFSKVDTNLPLPGTDRPSHGNTCIGIGGITPMPPKKSNTRHFRGMSSIVLESYLPSSCLFRKNLFIFGRHTQFEPKALNLGSKPVPCPY